MIWEDFISCFFWALWYQLWRFGNSFAKERIFCLKLFWWTVIPIYVWPPIFLNIFWGQLFICMPMSVYLVGNLSNVVTLPTTADSAYRERTTKDILRALEHCCEPQRPLLEILSTILRFTARFALSSVSCGSSGMAKSGTVIYDRGSVLVHTKEAIMQCDWESPKPHLCSKLALFNMSIRMLRVLP